jgi:CopG family nickel-responsive transcriptional regulator
MKPMKKDIEILSFSVPRETSQEIEKLTEEIGYSNRSELIRDAIRLLMKSKVEIDQLDGRVEGVIITLYGHSAENKVSEIRHGNMDIIKSFMHTDFNEKTKTCCDVLFYSGEAGRVKELAFNLKTVKDVKEVKLFVA